MTPMINRACSAWNTFGQLESFLPRSLKPNCIHVSIQISPKGLSNLRWRSSESSTNDRVDHCRMRPFAKKTVVFDMYTNSACSTHAHTHTHSVRLAKHCQNADSIRRTFLIFSPPIYRVICPFRAQQMRTEKIQLNFFHRNNEKNIKNKINCKHFVGKQTKALWIMIFVFYF